jgi:hypothetical protein
VFWTLGKAILWRVLLISLAPLLPKLSDYFYRDSFFSKFSPLNPPFSPLKLSSIPKESLTYASMTFRPSEEKSSHLTENCSADSDPVVYAHVKVTKSHLPVQWGLSLLLLITTPATYYFPFLFFYKFGTMASVKLLKTPSGNVISSLKYQWPLIFLAREKIAAPSSYLTANGSSKGSFYTLLKYGGQSLVHRAYPHLPWPTREESTKWTIYQDFQPSTNVTSFFISY